MDQDKAKDEESKQIDEQPGKSDSIADEASNDEDTEAAGKDVNEDIAKDVAEDIAKDVAEDIAKDVAEDVTEEGLNADDPNGTISSNK